MVEGRGKFIPLGGKAKKSAKKPAAKKRAPPKKATTKKSVQRSKGKRTNGKAKQVAKRLATKKSATKRPGILKKSAQPRRVTFHAQPASSKSLSAPMKWIVKAVDRVYPHNLRRRDAQDTAISAFRRALQSKEEEAAALDEEISDMNYLEHRMNQGGVQSGPTLHDTFVQMADAMDDDG